MDVQNHRNTPCLKSRPGEITPECSYFATILNPEPLNFFSIFRNADVSWRHRRRTSLRHDFGSYGSHGSGNGTGIGGDTLQQLAAIESSVDIEMNQILYVFLVGLCRT